MPLTTLRITTGEVSINIEGNGPRAILFIHGFPGRPQDFRWLTPYLKNDFTLYQIALPGLGTTPKTVFPETGVAAYGDFVCQCIDALELTHYALLGHSMGGPIATFIASKRPEQCQHLILLSSVGISIHRGFKKSAPRLTHWLLQRTMLHPVLIPLLRRAFTSMGFPRGLTPETMIHIISHVSQFSFADHHSNLLAWKEVPNSSQRTAMIFTTNDRLIEEHIYQELNELLQPAVTLQFSSGGHNPQKEHAETIAAQLQEWMQKSF